MSKRTGEKTNPSEPASNDGLNNAITISNVKTDEGFQIVEMFGHSIRADIDDGEPWLVIQDLSDALGIDRTTIPNMISRNEEVFEGWVRLVDITSTKKKSFDLKTGLNSLTVINEQATYSILGRLSTGRVKSVTGKKTIIQFQRGYPELLKMVRTGQVLIVKNKEWDAVRYLSKDGFKRAAKSIHDYINNLARNPEHENHVQSNNAKMVNKIVFGYHEKGMRNKATVRQLEAVYALDNLNSALIEQGKNVQRERQQILTDYFNRHFSGSESHSVSTSHQVVLA